MPKFRLRALMSDRDGTTISKAWVTNSATDSLRFIEALNLLKLEILENDEIPDDVQLFDLVTHYSGEVTTEALTEEEIRRILKEDIGHKNITYPEVMKAFEAFLPSGMDEAPLCDEPYVYISKHR